jgi:hypothetical protein
MAKMFPSTIIDITTPVADGATVVTEQVDSFDVQGKIAAALAPQAGA